MELLPGTVNQCLKTGPSNIKQPERKMSIIESCLRMGKRLTPEEKDYLRANAPDLYHKAVSIEAERDYYKKSLSNCRTKEQADRINRSLTYRFVAEINHVAKSAMPAGSKQEAINFLEYRTAAFGEAFREFVAEGKYSRLPSEQDALIQKIRDKEIKEKRRQEKIRAEKFLQEKILSEKIRMKNDSKRRLQV